MEKKIISHLEHALREAKNRDPDDESGIEVYLSEDEIQFLIQKLSSQ